MEKTKKILQLKIWAKLDNPVLELWIYEVLVNPYYWHLQVGNSARNCDVIEENSPLVMYTDFHKMSFLRTVRGTIILILSETMHTWCSNDILKKYTTGNIIFNENEKKVKLSLHNQWRVQHNYITNSGEVANLRKSIIRIF